MGFPFPKSPPAASPPPAAAQHRDAALFQRSDLKPCAAAAAVALQAPPSAASMTGSKAHGQHNKGHKTGKHAPKGQRHKQKEAKGAPCR